MNRWNWVFLAAFLAVTALPARASVVLQFDVSVQKGGAGTLLTFGGTIQNDDDLPQFLNEVSYTLEGAFPVDVTPFFSGPIVINVGETSPAFNWFTVLATTEPEGLYTGTFSIFGGADENALNLIGQADFGVEATPEPSTWSLLLVALGMLGVRMGKPLRIGKTRPS